MSNSVWTQIKDLKIFKGFQVSDLSNFVTIKVELSQFY